MACDKYTTNGIKKQINRRFFIFKVNQFVLELALVFSSV